MTTTQIPSIEVILSNERLYIENLMGISAKDQRLLPFKFNNIQTEFDENETGRDIVVKPAQVGFSSMLIAKMLYRTMKKPNTTSVIVAYEDFITQRLLNKAQAFYDSVPDTRNSAGKLIFKPELHRRGTNEKYFAEINSVLYIGSARSYTFARGEAINHFLADEFAFWPDPERIISPAMDRVVRPSQGGSFWVISTPNGADNAFHDMYVNAKEGRIVGESTFRAHFYPYTQHEEYQLSPGHPDALEKDRGELNELNSDELALINSGVTTDQVRWRRMKKYEKQLLRRRGDISLLFEQEYPLDDESCFLAAGDMAYDHDLLRYKISQCHPPIATEYGISIWEAPKAGETYWMSVDPGQGKKTFSAVTVLRFWLDEETGEERGKLCARYAELVNENETAEMIVSHIGRMYNRPTAVVEANGHGRALLAELFHRGYPIYKRRDVVSGRQTRQPGWLTSSSTKPAMIKEVIKMLPNLEIYDSRILGELYNIRVDPDTRRYVSVGQDDLHDSLAIGVVTRQIQSFEYGMIEYGW